MLKILCHKYSSLSIFHLTICVYQDPKIFLGYFFEVSVEKYLLTVYYIDSNQWNSQIFEGTNVKNLAILSQYYLQHIAGTFKSTKSEKGGQGPIPNPSIATQGHAWVSDGWYWVAKSIKIWKNFEKKKFFSICFQKYLLNISHQRLIGLSKSRVTRSRF